ncbi:hypothetical protein ARMGADRAFT_1089303 [Armillaria gallica]|uniref:Uncharacterized protein n=1 Tax=Armillaria gallica TaxID=47427 RepID=A0A2H3D356_ARMGA|nr:hypothetical protein ARMGADRAFT_1089303 [Armillaria gallica]
MSNDDRDSDAYMDVDSPAVDTTDDAKTMTTVTPTALAATIRPRPQYCLPPCILHFQRREQNPVTRATLGYDIGFLDDVCFLSRMQRTNCTTCLHGLSAVPILLPLGSFCRKSFHLELYAALLSSHADCPKMLSTLPLNEHGLNSRFLYSPCFRIHELFCLYSHFRMTELQYISVYMDLGRSVSATYGSSRDIGGDAVTDFYDELGSAMSRTEPSLFPMGRHVMDTTSPKKPYSSLHACG